MNKYEVGQIIEKFKNYQEGMRFELSDDGAVLQVFMETPTKNEIEQFGTKNRFEIRFTEMYNVIMITTKIGNLNWMDAPYSPHLSENLNKFQLPNENQGLGLTLVLIDCLTGEIKHLRFLSLSEHFTKNLFGVIMEQKIKPFNIEEYRMGVSRIYASYSTNKLVKLSKDYCKIN
jgi:hypothetical protein